MILEFEGVLSFCLANKIHDVQAALRDTCRSKALHYTMLPGVKQAC